MSSENISMFPPHSLVSVLFEGTSSNVQMLHQKSMLEFEYLPAETTTAKMTMTTETICGRESPISVLPQNRDSVLCNSTNEQWTCHGRTVLYMIDHSFSTSTEGAIKEQVQQHSNNNYHSLGLHFRPSHSCHVEKVEVFTSSSNTNKIVPLSQIQHIHTDPLFKIVRSSSSSNTCYEADAQLTRGGSGFATSLRAAGIASADGELKIAFSLTPDSSTTTKDDANATNDITMMCTEENEEDAWNKDLLQYQSPSSSSSHHHEQHHHHVHALQKKLHSQTCATRRNQRIHLVSKMLTEASLTSSSTNNTNKLPLKIVIHWTLTNSNSCQQQNQQRSAGLFMTSSKTTPHAYTLSSSTRGWLPCVDNLFIFGKASHEIFLSITAHQDKGLSLVSSGEDFVENTIISFSSSSETGETNWIATHMIASSTYEAIPCNCLGFAIGPFQFILDPECSSTTTTSTTEERQQQQQQQSNSDGTTTTPTTTTNDTNNPKHKKKKKSKEHSPRRKQGIIRQAIFAPLQMRARLHSDHRNNKFHCSYIVSDEEDEDSCDDVKTNLCHALQSTVTYSTSGIALRALHFCSLLLAGAGGGGDAAATTTTTATTTRQLCSVYTQVWIPKCIDGGYAVGAPHQSTTHNSFVGGCILDTRLLPPLNKKIPFYHGGRALQLAQARNVIWMWLKVCMSIGNDSTNLSTITSYQVTAAVSGDDVDEVGDGYLLEVFYQYIMHLYEQAFGGTGEGGSCHSMFYTARYADNADSRYPGLIESLLALQNIDDDDDDVDNKLLGGVSASEVVFGGANDESSSQHLYRNVNPSWSESRTSAADEAIVRSILRCDVVESLHNRSTMSEKYPVPSMGWNAIGSLLSLSYLASNTTNATRSGCGVVDATHPTQLMYREAKGWWVAKISAARAGPDNLMRTIRACILAGTLYSCYGWTCLPPDMTARGSKENFGATAVQACPTPRFLLVLEEVLKRGGITHVVFTKSLRLLAGPSKEVYLNGSLVDIAKEYLDVKGNRNNIPEGFPNSYVRGASTLLLRVGVHVEPVGTTDVTGTSSQPKGTHLHINVEPAIPSDGIAFGGPIHLRVVENGACREFVRTLNLNSSLSQWGPISLYSNPVTTAKAQLAAIGHTAMEGVGTGPSASMASSTSSNKAGIIANKSGSAATIGEKNLTSMATATKGTNSTKQKPYSVFTDNMLHSGGYQALELVRLTNRTPLLWCTIDPGGYYGGRIAISQPDAYWGEMLFHDVNASGQIEAIRALAEKPSRIQGNVNVTSVFDVNVSELPVRLLGDCLRGSAALHSSIPHSPTIRAQAALAIAQWQNNKAPQSSDAAGASDWIGLKLLRQYFYERFTCTNSDGSITVLPCKYTRETIQKAEGGDYLYLDEVDKDDQAEYSTEARIEIEEDEEYRIRSAVITAISCVRAKDGQTPPLVIEFLEMLLPVCDGAVFSTSSTDIVGNRIMQHNNGDSAASACEVQNVVATSPELFCGLSFVDPILIANTLLSLCNVNARPASAADLNDDVVMGGVKSHTNALTPTHHPVQLLLDICRRWLDWALYQETIAQRFEAETQTGIGGGFFSIIPPSAITSLCSLTLLKQSTSSTRDYHNDKRFGSEKDTPENCIDVDDVDDPETVAKVSMKSKIKEEIEEAATAQFYINIFEDRPLKSDITRAAAAQAVTCICCAADRLKTSNEEALGLLTSLEFLLEEVLDCSTVSPELRQTLALLMMDACTGKVCSTQRVATLGGRNDLDVYRFSCGPLGSTFGGDNGSSILLTVSEELYPAANAVNDGARAGLRLLTRCGLDSSSKDETVVRVAKFATKLWRVMNGEDPVAVEKGYEGVCSSDPILRTTLLSLWQWIYPKGCIAIIRVQSWRSMKGDSSHLQKYLDLSSKDVVNVNDEEKKFATEEETRLSDLQNVVLKEINRQMWRCDMSSEAYDILKVEALKDPTATLGGVGQPLPVLNKDFCWRNGAWAASTALQRREKALDGGTSVTKLRLSVPAKGGNE